MNKLTVDKKFEYWDVICDAVLIQFRDNLISKSEYPVPLEIPEFGDIKEMINKAVSEIGPKKISKRLVDGLGDITLEGSSDSWFRRYLWEGRFYHHWIYMQGDFFTYKTYKDRTEAVERVHKYFTKKELEDIKKIGIIIRKEISKKLNKKG
jgi:hypothetical protein